MNLTENFRMALGALVANKLRALLTMLGIIIGVAAVITLVSVGRGVEGVVLSEFEGLGNNLLFVFPGQVGPDQQGPLRSGGAGLTDKDVAALADPLRVPDVLRLVPIYERPAIVVNGRHDARTTITGTTPDYVDIRQFYPVAGSFFQEQDIQQTARVAVLGQTAYENLFPDGGSPVGETLRINNVNFRVIGLMEEKGGSGFNDQDDVIFVPISTAQRRLFPARRADGQLRVDYILAELVDETRQDAAITEMTLVLREMHNISFEDEDDFTVLSQEELIGALSQITSVLTVFLGVIAGISLLVGGIGIMNIMLVSVTERTREIGLRKAVGAKQRDILWQFLIEAMVMALVGGVIGLGLGAAGSLIISNLSDSLQPTLAWDSVALAIVFSAAVGLFFGIFPASRAARLNPIDALRYE
ncbi:MAG: ABC transporter permease [Ardenticatenaceae bacterium]|nr:ABC transporter permease [Ardenticatenaceae bacterium]MCB9443251.1 ABC transporter permease [Ardenticatenaceae bacterium]